MKNFRIYLACVVAVAFGSAVQAGQILVYSDPSGAQVFVDDSTAAAITPCFIETKGDKQTKVRVTKEGHETSEQIVPLVLGQLQTIRISLKPKASAAAPALDLPVNRGAPPPAVAPTTAAGSALVDSLLVNAQAEQKAGNWQRASLILEAAMEISPGDVRLYVELGKMYLGNGQPDRAKPRLQEANRLFPDNVGIQVLMAYYHFQKGNAQEADILLNAIVTRAGKDVITLLSIGDIYTQMNLIDRALQVYAKVHELEPSNHVVKQIGQELRTPGSPWDKRWQVYEQSKTPGISGELERLRKEHDQQRAIVARMTEDLKAVENKESNFRSSVTEAVQNFAAAQEQKTVLTAKIKSIEDDSKAQLEAVRQLKDRSLAIQANISSLAQKLVGLDKQVEDQDKAVARSAAALNAADSRVIDLEKQLAAAREAQAFAQKAHLDARVALEASAGQRKIAQSEYEKVSADAKSVEELAVAAQGAISKLDREKTDTHAALKTATQQSDQFNTKMQGLLSEREQARASVGKVRSGLENTIVSYNSIGQRIADLDRQRQEIVANLAALKGRFLEAQTPAPSQITVQPSNIAPPVAPTPPAPPSTPEAPVPPKPSAAVEPETIVQPIVILLPPSQTPGPPAPVVAKTPPPAPTAAPTPTASPAPAPVVTAQQPPAPAPAKQIEPTAKEPSKQGVPKVEFDF